jgi:hypothetical protein
MASIMKASINGEMASKANNVSNESENIMAKMKKIENGVKRNIWQNGMKIMK